MRNTFFIAAIFFIAAFILPIFIPPWAAFYQEYSMAIALLFVFFACALQKPVWSISPIVLVVSSIALMPLIQWYFGVISFFGDGIVVSLYLLGAALALACGQNIVLVKQRDQALIVFSAVVFVLAFINVFFALCQFFHLDLGLGSLIVKMKGYRAYGNLGQPNNFASVLLMSFLCGWYLFEKGWFCRKVYYLWALFIMLGLVLTQSRTTFLAGFLIFVFYCLSCRSVVFKTTIKDWLVVLACYGFCWLIIFYPGSFLSGESGLIEIRSSAVYDKERLSMWYEAIIAIIDGPLWGYGWNQIGVAQVLVSSDVEAILHFHQSHNLFLDLLLYNGPILGGVMVVAIIGFAWQAFRHCKTIEGWIILAIIGAIVSHAMVEYPLHYAYFLLPTAFLVGLLDDSGVELDSEVGSGIGNSVAKKGGFHYPSWCNIPIVLSATAIMVLLWNDYRIVKDEIFRLDFEVKGVFSREIETERTDEIVLLTQQREFIHYGRAQAGAGMSDAQLQWMKNVSHRFASPYNLSKYAKACQLNGRYTEAGRVLKVIRRFYGERMYLYSKSVIYENADDD
jgi:hypothetical protein